VQIVQFSGADESPAPVVVIDGWTIHLFLSADSPRTVFDRDIAGEPDRSGLPRLAQAGYHVVAQANPTEDAQVSVLDVDVYAHRADAFDQPEKYELLMTIDGEDALGQFYRLEAGHYQAALVLGRDIPPTFTFVIRAVFATDHPPADSRRWKVKPKNLEAVGGGSLQLLHKVVGPEAGSAFPDGYVVDVSETNESDQANVWFDIYVLPLSDGRS
jgi:hypothetical protein